MENIQPDKALARQEAKPELITIGKKQIIATGRWNDYRVMEHIIANARKEWMPVGELARFAWGQNNIANKRRARAYLGRLWRLMMVEKQLLLSIHYDPLSHSQATMVKVYDPENESERAALNKKLTKLFHNRELTEESYSTALELLGEKSSPTDEEAA